MRVRRAVAIAAAAVAAVALLLAAVTSTDQRMTSGALEGQLDEVVTAGVPGAVILVVDGSSETVAARGVANLSSGEPLEASDRFRAGSITKTFVAALVLQLVAEGSLELDAPLSRWLPGLIDPAITVRQLLSHRSGLSDYVDDDAIVEGPGLSPATLTRRALKREPLARPGERYAYASTNYLLLGLLVERVTGESLAAELETRLFRPLTLRRTTFEPDRVELDAHGYRRSAHDGIVSGEPVDTAGGSAAWAWSAGAVVSDADDLATFMTALVRGRIVPRPLLEQMLPTSGYGLGVASFPTSCGTAIGHTGNVEGYVSVAWTRSDARRAVVFMANSYPLPADADAAIHRLLDDAFCGALR
jgi:D-alanyl-D-alanine carboxypeptidase